MAIWILIHDQTSSTIHTATTTFATSNETVSVSQTPSVSSSKVEDIEEKSPNQKERNYFWESYYWYKYAFSGIFGDMCVLNV